MLLDFLAEEHRDKKKSCLNVFGWKLTHEKKIPQQAHDDCGIFAIKYAQYFAMGKPMTFKTENMRYYRDRLIWEMKNKKLLWP